MGEINGSRIHRRRKANQKLTDDWKLADRVVVFFLSLTTSAAQGFVRGRREIPARSRCAAEDKNAVFDSRNSQTVARSRQQRQRSPSICRRVIDPTLAENFLLRDPLLAAEYIKFPVYRAFSVARTRPPISPSARSSLEKPFLFNSLEFWLLNSYKTSDFIATHAASCCRYSIPCLAGSQPISCAESQAG